MTLARPLFALLVALQSAGSSLPAAEAGHGTGASATEIAAASEDGQNAIKTFKYDPGLKVDLWAAEPLLANPVAFAQDEKGRWYVAETFRQERGIEDDRGHQDWQDDDIASKSVEDRLAMMHKFYPDTAKFAEKFEKYEERIRRLEDTTGSGVANTATVFADGFRNPLDGTGAGIIARGNDVWWTCIPNLWHFRDTKGTGVADVKEKLLSGFGIKFALRGHDMHGLRFGPDGKLYFSIGDRALHIKTKEGADLAQTESGSIMRCNPDGTEFEIFCTGVRNPQELAFDEHGNLFTCDNNSDAGDKARFTYLVEGADCGWRMGFQYLPDRGPWMRERPWDEKIGRTIRYIVPCVANIGNGPSGLTYNPGTGLSKRYQEKFYLSDFRGGANASVVHEITTQPDGAFFKAAARDWVKGVLTTDVEFGNDGSLYVLDWVASWGGVGKGRIYKFTDPNADRALQKQVEKLIFDGMTQRPPGELAHLLSHPDARVRQAAQFELATRGASSIATLESVAKGGDGANALGRLHAIWGLGQLARLAPKALEAIPALLKDPDPEVRAQAASLAGTGKLSATADQLIQLLADHELRVRFFAASSLGKLAPRTAFEPLCKMLAENEDRDPILRHGGVMGLVSCATPAELAGKAHDPSAAVRGAVVVALRRLANPLVAEFLKDADASVVLEAARAIYDAPVDAALPALAALTGDDKEIDPFVLSRAVQAHFRLGKKENAVALAHFAASKGLEAARKDALDALGNWATPNGKDRLLNQWRPLPPRPVGDAAAAVDEVLGALLTTAPFGIQEAAAKLAAKLSLHTAGEPLLLLATNQKAPANARVEAIKALAALQDARLSKIADLATRDKEPKVRSASLQALSVTEPKAAISVIATVVEQGTALEKQSALSALSQMKTPEAASVLGRLLDQLIAGKLPPEIQLDAVAAATNIGSPELTKKLAQFDASLPATDDLAKYRTALFGGDAERGRKIFREKAETQCLRCHKCEVGDSLVGPDLTHIGSMKDRPYLLESIVFPSKQIAAGFETVVLTLTDGNMIAGRLLTQKDTGLEVETFDAAGKPLRMNVPMAKIKRRDTAPSPMPPNMADLLSRFELRDVVEYLATRK